MTTPETPGERLALVAARLKLVHGDLIESDARAIACRAMNIERVAMAVRDLRAVSLDMLSREAQVTAAPREMSGEYPWSE